MADTADNSVRMTETQEMKQISQPKRSTQPVAKPKPVHAEDRKENSQPQETSRNSRADMANGDNVTQLAGKYEDLKESFDELHKELKIANRDNREQSLELRDLRRQNTMIKEAYTNMRKEIQSDNSKLSKNERTKYIEHFEMLEEQAAYFQHEFRKREGHLGYLTKQTRDANNEKEAIEEDNRKLQRKMRELSANLTECRDDLLRLQPPNQTSDSEIADHYSNLCQQIAGWVDDQTEDPDSLEGYFEKLKVIGDLPQEMRIHVSNRHFKFGKTSPECLPLFVQYLIHCRLQDEVLGPCVFVFGLEEPNVALLQGIEEGISELEPKRDNLTIGRWRSETLQGLFNMEAFAKEQSRHAENFAQALCSTLSNMLSTTEDDWKGLHKQIIEPAVKLANAIRVSTTDYELLSHLFARPPGQPNAIHRNEIQHYQMMDNATHKIIRADSCLRISEDGKIGEEMFIISPGIVRSHKDSVDRVVLCKPTILVKLDEPMGKRGRGFKALGSWTPSWFSGADEVS